MNETVVYKSKASKKKAIFVILVSIFCLLCSIGSFVLCNAKYEKTTMRFGYYGSDGNVVWTEEKTGYINGAVYYLTEEGRQAVTVLGVVFLLMGVFLLPAGLGIKRCYLEIHNDHISGVKYTRSFVKRHFSVPYEQVESVSFHNGVVSIRAGTLVTVLCDDAEEVYNRLWPYCPHK